MEADPRGRCGDGHGPGHRDPEGVMVLPAVCHLFLTAERTHGEGEDDPELPASPLPCPLPLAGPSQEAEVACLTATLTPRDGLVPKAGVLHFPSVAPDLYAPAS